MFITIYYNIHTIFIFIIKHYKSNTNLMFGIQMKNNTSWYRDHIFTFHHVYGFDFWFSLFLFLVLDKICVWNSLQFSKIKISNQNARNNLTLHCQPFSISYSTKKEDKCRRRKSHRRRWQSPPPLKTFPWYLPPAGRFLPLGYPRWELADDRETSPSQSVPKHRKRSKYALKNL